MHKTETLRFSLTVWKQYLLVVYQWDLALKCKSPRLHLFSLQAGLIKQGKIQKIVQEVLQQRLSGQQYDPLKAAQATFAYRSIYSYRTSCTIVQWITVLYFILSRFCQTTFWKFHIIMLSTKTNVLRACAEAPIEGRMEHQCQNDLRAGTNPHKKGQ